MKSEYDFCQNRKRNTFVFGGREMITMETV